MASISSSRRHCSTPNLTNELKDNTVHLHDLQISFRRTIRVPDNAQSSKLPPSLGKFPLYQVKSYRSQLPPEMVAKGGLFFPMYQKEAMWIRFRSKMPYAIKIYVGAVNAISGEPAVETAATKLRRQRLLSEKKSIQDYVVVPEQYWLDGIATSEGKVRQFVAMPIGSGYSVEAQVTGEDVTGGLQFEITPATEEYRRTYNTPLSVTVQTLTGKAILLSPLASNTVKDLKKMIQKQETMHVHKQKLIYQGRVMEDDELLSYYSLVDGSIINLVLDSRGEWQESIKFRPLGSGGTIYIDTLTERIITIFDVRSEDTTDNLKLRIQDIENIPPDMQRFIFDGKQLEDGKTLGDYNIYCESTVYMLVRVVGGGTGGRIERDRVTARPADSISTRNHRTTTSQFPPVKANSVPPPFPRQSTSNSERLAQSTSTRSHRSSNSQQPLAKEMNIAPGGLITQSIVQDSSASNVLGQASVWGASRTKVFNVQILNTAYFQQVTGFPALESPVDAKTCAAYGIPFYDMKEAPTEVAGDFRGVKSIAQMDGVVEPVVRPSRILQIRGLPSSSPSSSSPSRSTPRSSSAGPSTLFKSSSLAKGESKSTLSEDSSGTSTSMMSDSTSSGRSDIRPAFWNKKGPMSPFRSVSEIEKELRAREIVTF
ncbi:hypothetical protein B0O99DRAFT_155247 [Bisporella sp. PMI_857]|nr:hypothetical protein B0O99DRAFT_155247 [Bisporella sp. PMI_857]